MSEAAVSYTDNLLALRKDAAQIVSDITLLTEQIAASGAEMSKEIETEITAKLNEQMEAVTLHLKNLNDSIKIASQKADAHVKTHPYAYILGALGLGFLLAKTRKNSVS
jgi:ElaB/YqjD/DUF883 family membrane-anchored ribosome-binding protein